LSKRTGFQTTPVPKAVFDAVYRDSCGAGGVSPAGETAFLRGPYLQKMTDESVEILWTSDSSEASSVVVRKPDGSPVVELDPVVDEQSDRQEFAQYVTKVAGLESETIYCYEVRGENGAWLEATGFRTAPGPDSTTPIKIVALGDLGQRTPDQYAVLSQIEQVQYDLVLIPGDLAYDKGTLSDHEMNFFQVYEHIMRSIPFFVISGNHDYAADGAVFREVFSLPENGGPGGVEKWYSLDWGSVHIVALDTEKIGDAQQVAWLEADLAANRQPTTIVFMHRPPYSSGSHGSTKSTHVAFTPLFVEHEVDLVLAGHDHNYERTQAIDGVSYVVTGGGGRGTRPVGTSWFTEYSERVAHFTHITVGPEELSLHAIDASGIDFDAVVLERN
jgi:Icc-related predicted phosphoesterase